MTSCERVQHRFLRKWLCTDFEQSLEFESLAEDPEACAAGDFFLELNDNVIARHTRYLLDFSAFF